MTANYLECIGLYMTSGINCNQAEEKMVRSVLGVFLKLLRCFIITDFSKHTKDGSKSSLLPASTAYSNLQISDDDQPINIEECLI